MGTAYRMLPGNDLSPFAEFGGREPTIDDFMRRPEDVPEHVFFVQGSQTPRRSPITGALGFGNVYLTRIPEIDHDINA